MLKEAVTITSDAELICRLIEESKEVKLSTSNEFVVRLLRHPVEGLISITTGALTDDAVITKVAE